MGGDAVGGEEDDVDVGSESGSASNHSGTIAHSNTHTHAHTRSFEVSGLLTPYEVPPAPPGSVPGAGVRAQPMAVHPLPLSPLATVGSLGALPYIPENGNNHSDSKRIPPSGVPAGPSSPPVQELESGTQSEDECDPLEPSASSGIYNNMLSLAEAARLKADGLDDPEMYAPEEERERERERKRKLKRVRVDDGHHVNCNDTPQVYEPQPRDTPRVTVPLQRGALHRVQSPIELGFCTLQRGRQLFDLFTHGAAMYVPIFDPAVDTYEAVCASHPFTLTVLFMVSAKIEDAGGPPSALQVQCKEHAENIGE
jgi:hypothetical protein